jgi:hypothetical protein
MLLRGNYSIPRRMGFRPKYNDNYIEGVIYGEMGMELVI